MRFGKYRNTTLSSITLADSITGLLSKHVITADVAAASELIPYKFCPRFDAAFYSDIYWKVPFDEVAKAAQTVTKRFNRWYEKTIPVEQRIYTAIAALTDSDDQIDVILDEAKDDLISKHRIKMIDCDDAIYFVFDYNAARDPFNIVNALNRDEVNWWCSRFEEQARRILSVPTIEFQHFLSWNRDRADFQYLIRDHFRKSPFEKGGFTIHQGRRILNRSIRLTSSFFGPEPTREFMAGKPLKIRGYYFEWEMKIWPSTLVNYTIRPPEAHVPYGLYLNDLEGNRLAHACVIFDKTPILEQAVSIAISISSSEDELELLRKTNIYHLTEMGRENDNLSNLELPHVQRLTPHQVATNRYEEYTEERYTNYDWDEGDRWTRTEENAIIEARLNHIYAMSSAWSHENPEIAELTRQSLRETIRIRLRRERDPITCLLRNELYRRLDINPDLLEYMSAPEISIMQLNRFDRFGSRAPRLQAFIEHKTSLGVGAWS